MKPIPALLAAWVLTTASLHAESYAEWLTGAPADSAQNIHFKPVPGGETISATTNIDQGDKDKKGNNYYWQIPIVPLGHQIGTLAADWTTSAGIVRPVRLNLYYTEVLTRDLYHPREAQKSIEKLSWNSPLQLLNYKAQIRAVRETLSYELNPAQQGEAIPIFLKTLPWRASMWDGSHRLLSVRAEWVDGAGRILGRCLVVELFSSQDQDGGRYNQSASGWTTGDQESDRQMREWASILNIHTLKTLPATFEPYLSIDALWLESGQEPEAQIPAALARRLLLSGLWIYGRESTTERLRQAVGLPAGQECVLWGGIQTLKTGSYQQNRNKNRGMELLRVLGQPQYYSHTEKIDASYALPNSVNLFAALRKPYLWFTGAALGVFALFCATGMPLAFVFLRGKQRVVLWWAVPALTVLYGVLCWLAGRAVLPDNLQAHTVEYRFAYGDWPEVYCQSVSDFINLQEQTITWKSPGELLLVQEGSRYELSGGSGKRGLSRATQGSAFRLEEVQKGIHRKMEFSSYTNLEKPVELFQDGGKVQVKARTLLKAVYMKSATGWVAAKGVATDVVIDFEKAGTRLQKIQNLPQSLTTTLEDFSDANGDSNRYVVAVTDEKPCLSVESTGSNTSSAVIWILQLPVRTGPPEVKP